MDWKSMGGGRGENGGKWERAVRRGSNNWKAENDTPNQDQGSQECGPLQEPSGFCRLVKAFSLSGVRIVRLLFSHGWGGGGPLSVGLERAVWPGDVSVPFLRLRLRDSRADSQWPGREVSPACLIEL